MAKPKKKKKKPANPNEKTVAQNKKATLRFEILEKIECGIVLHGSEVKSIRDGNMSLDEAYAHIRDGELFLVGADISAYSRTSSYLNHLPRRVRKLLVHKKEITRLLSKTKESGLTLVPLKVYFTARGIAKMLLGIGKGKKLHDKREDLKKRDTQREISREMRARGR